MSILDNGTVLPHGLVGIADQEMMGGFNKAYKNFGLRAGVIVASYPKGKGNVTATYDVLVLEQSETKAPTPTLYKNCVSSQGFGSIADFFERTLRPMKKKKTKGQTPDFKGNDGAMVLLLCLDGISGKGIILGALQHSDRTSTLVDEGPRLEGEFNGVNIKVEKDGSTKLTFRGATDGDGNPIDSSQGGTEVRIEKDGSVQVGHDAVTFRLDRQGTASLTTKKDTTLTVQGQVTIVANADVNVTCTNANITASGKAVVEGSEVDLGKGAAEAVIKGDTFKKLFEAHIHPTAVGPSGPPAQPLPPSVLSKKVKVE